ncbi:MAG: DNA-processing protein DprA [Candidatus Krumholzibacteria bacterium]|nr:DNA-processing protein DprA [Candidatus Krumholzibacteria bacterium]
MMRCSDAASRWVRILSVREISQHTWILLAERLGAARIVSMLETQSGRRELGSIAGREIGEPSPHLIEKVESFLARKYCGVLCREDPGYPSILQQTDDPPVLLFYDGDPAVAGRPAVCIVGSRRSSRRGMIIARELAWELSRRGILVVSGMARGIDTVAHDGALAGEGGTCAVLACGIDVPYPQENAALALEIARHGCLFSEFPPGTPPMKHHFPRRNRILSGLSLGVVVVEAGLDSGAMNTARWAIDQNREVFAVPGPVEQETCRGPHHLIKQGAMLVESVGDILAALPPCGRIVDGPTRAQPGGRDTVAELDDVERSLVDALDLNPKHIDDLVRICHSSPTVILPLLLDLEMRGIIESCGGGTYAVSGALRRSGDDHH